MSVSMRVRWLVAVGAVLGLVNVGAAIVHRDPIAGLKTLVWLLSPATPLAAFLFYGSLLALIAAPFIFLRRTLRRHLSLLLLSGLALAVAVGFASYAAAIGMPHAQACGERLLFITENSHEPFPGSPYGPEDFILRGVVPHTPADDLDALAEGATTVLIHAGVLDELDDEWVRLQYEQGKAIALIGVNIYGLKDFLGIVPRSDGWADTPEEFVPVSRVGRGRGNINMTYPEFQGGYLSLGSMLLFAHYECVPEHRPVDLLVPFEVQIWLGL